jgi:hypothetical protein
MQCELLMPSHCTRRRPAAIAAGSACQPPPAQSLSAEETTLVEPGAVPDRHHDGTRDGPHRGPSLGVRRAAAAMRGLWPWIERVAKRLAHRNLLAIALTNKLARIAWASARPLPEAIAFEGSQAQRVALVANAMVGQTGVVVELHGILLEP